MRLDLDKLMAEHIEKHGPYMQTKTEPKLWAIYLFRSTEIVAAPSRDAAFAKAEQLNTKTGWEKGITAAAIEYPGTPESHAEEVKRWDEK
jgi:hypothetical protein